MPGGFGSIFNPLSSKNVISFCGFAWQLSSMIRLSKKIVCERTFR